ncbi:MAG: hypothetical protein ACRDP6_15065 [Actinoallomurus sp.]
MSALRLRTPFRVAPLRVAAVFAAMLVAGCSAGDGEAGRLSPPARVNHIAQRISLGDTSLAPRVRGLTLLVVGDSWARNLGVGMASADRDRRNVVVNAGVGGCGLMVKYHPSAVLLEVGYWDGQDSQRLSGQKDVGSITDPVFRRRFDQQIDRAVRVLGSGGTRVYVPTVIDNDGATRANSDAMNTAVHAAVRRNPQARLLDLHGQMCGPAKICPAEIAGVPVYDETGHPSGPAGVRLGAWILNSVYADLHKAEN